MATQYAPILNTAPAMLTVKGQAWAALVRLETLIPELEPADRAQLLDELASLAEEARAE